MPEGSQGFWAFYRQYTHTGIHTAATAALTAIGLLVFVHWSFAVLAITNYVLPPVVLYLYEDPETDELADIVPDTGSHAEYESETAAGPVEKRTKDRTEPFDSTPPDDTAMGDAADAKDTAGADETERQSTGAPIHGKSGGSGNSSTEGSSNTADDPDKRADRDGSESRIAPDSGSDPAPNSEHLCPDSEPGERAGRTGEPTADTESSEPDSAKAQTSVAADDSNGADREWTEVDAPTDEGLCDVVIAWDGPYVVGDEGTVLARRDGWETVLERGPTTQGNALCGAAVSADGRHVWFAGNSGVLGQYDAEELRFTDYSAPRNITNDWADVAAVGSADEETLYLVDDSGQILRGENDGGAVTWDEPRTPGDGSSMTSVAFIDGAGYCCDTNAGVYETTDGGDSWERIGIENAGADFTDIAPVSRNAISVSCDDGTVFRYDGINWTKRYVGEESLCAIDRTDEIGLVSGEDGAIYDRIQGGWERESTPVEATLHAVAIGTDCPSVAVGEDGTILEHPPAN